MPVEWTIVGKQDWILGIARGVSEVCDPVEAVASSQYLHGGSKMMASPGDSDC